jgi:hypothetical protein
MGGIGKSQRRGTSVSQVSKGDSGGINFYRGKARKLVPTPWRRNGEVKVVKPGAKTMTGEEWLIKFKQEIPTWSQGDRTALGFERVYLEAAKKVAGLE